MCVLGGITVKGGAMLLLCQEIAECAQHCAAFARGALLGPLDLLCLDSHHAPSLARISALKKLHACCVVQLSYITDAFLVDASLLLSLLAHPLNYLHSTGCFLHMLLEGRCQHTLADALA